MWVKTIKLCMIWGINFATLSKHNSPKVECVKLFHLVMTLATKYVATWINVVQEIIK